MYCPRVAQRDKPKQANNVGTQEALSSVKAKKVKRREERGEKKGSKLRGGVESGLSMLEKSIEYVAKRVFPAARRAERDAHGMRACHSVCLSTMRDAKLQRVLHLCASGEQERLQKEQTDRMLRSSHECQAKDVRKGGRKAMKSDGKRRGIGWASVTGETLIPRETPMRTLSSGVSLWRFALVFLLRWKRSRRKHDGL